MLSKTKPSIENIKSKKKLNSNQVLVNDDNKNIILSYNIEKVSNEKQLNKIIYAVEKLIRTSPEYKQYIGILKEDLNLNNCTLLGNVNNEDAAIEFHHYPFTLYDIVEIVIFYNLVNKEMINTFKLASQVIDLHFENKIGLVPLSRTAHQLAHAQQLFISLNQVFGSVQEFIEEYKVGIKRTLIKKINDLITKSKNQQLDKSRRILETDMKNVKGYDKFID